MAERMIALLRAARAAEKDQTLYYRALAALAEDHDDAADVEALNGLLADEQHHLSRLTVRLLELGADAPALVSETPACEWPDWQSAARAREQAEILRYENLLQNDLDASTASMIRSILEVERQHQRNLGGKYTEA